MNRYRTLLLLLLVPWLLTGCGRSEPDEVQTQTDTALTEPKVEVVEEAPLPVDRIARGVADRLPRTHLNRIRFDGQIATNAVMLFIEMLDYDRTYFLASDVEEFQEMGTQLHEQVRAGDASFAHTVVDRFRERVNDRVEVAYELLDREMDLESGGTWIWRRRDAGAPWAADQEEWDDLWRRKIKNEVISRLAAIEAAEELDEDLDQELEESEAPDPVEAVRERYKQFRLLIENNYDDEMVLQRYLSAFARSYDPHSDYLSPRNVEDFDIQMRLSLVGIGATLRSEDGAAKVIQLIAGGPAERDGRLQPGDKIIAVGQGDEEPVSILHWPLSKAVRQIRGEKGTRVVLRVIPVEDTTGLRTRTIDLIRDEVKLEEQAAKASRRELVSPDGTEWNFGVITLPEFYADFTAVRNRDEDARRASTDVRALLEEFRTNRVDGVVLDLRNNGGGSLAEAVEIAGFFIPLGPIVQVREHRGVTVLPDSDPVTVYSGPLVVLVNRMSASASEIVAAALQDYGRAVIVGDSKTHGKGTVQTVYPLSRSDTDLGSLKVTTAGFYRIAGGSTQLKGVTPDVVLPSLYDALEIGEEFLPNPLPWSQVRPAWFRPWYHPVGPMIPELVRCSAERIEDNELFGPFLARRDRIRRRMEMAEVSLNLSDRIRQIQIEKELESLHDEITEPDEDEEKDDLILDEALQILRDLASLLDGGGQITQTAQ